MLNTINTVWFCFDLISCSRSEYERVAYILVNPTGFPAEREVPSGSYNSNCVDESLHDY